MTSNNGKIFDGRWKFVGCHNHKYKFVNIFNGREITLTYRSYKNVIEGKDTISHFIARNLLGNDNNFVFNNICAQNSYRKKYFAEKEKKGL